MIFPPECAASPFHSFGSRLLLSRAPMTNGPFAMQLHSSFRRARVNGPSVTHGRRGLVCTVHSLRLALHLMRLRGIKSYVTILD